ncbi:MAG TPA: DUF4156 domain-containing protein, partial [Xanthomonadaceae bacterium]|nr:DUF4156 domain-containing protein [Xanthomonadaceae bacterium]
AEGEVGRGATAARLPFSQPQQAGRQSGLLFSPPGARMRRLVLVPALVFLLPACTWVHMAPGASAVKVVTVAPGGCERRGEVEVSVKDRLGPIERNPRKVRDELETLARNEGPGLAADTMQPLDGPEDGTQRWVAWRCRR